MKNTIQKIIIAAAFFAAGLSNISANAEGAATAGFDTDFSPGSPDPTILIIGVAVGYPAEEVMGETERLAVAHSALTCQSHPDTASTCSAVARNVNGEEYFAVYADLSIPNLGDVATIEGLGDTAAEARQSAMNQCADPANCDCLVVARDITENAIPLTDVFTFTAADAGRTTTCDTVIETDFCDGTTANLNEAGDACECATDELPILETGGLSCRAVDATDCGQNERPDFWDGSMCVATCPADEFNGNCVAACLDGETRNTAGVCELNSQDNTETGTNPPETQNPTTQTPQNRADNKERRVKSINTATGLLAVGVIAVFLAGGVPSFNMSPDFGYSITESGYYANVGGRADFRKDNWHLYYSAKQTNANGDFGDFRYTSGGKYNGDLFTAAFSESVAGETANSSFMLSADIGGSLMMFSPVYRLHSEYDKGETETRNELNLQGNFRYDGWTILPSAGFRWENAKDFTENARFQINAIHRF